MDRKNYLSIETVFSKMKKTVAYDYYETDEIGKKIPYTVITHYNHNDKIENMQFFAEGKAKDILLPLDPETTVEIKVGQLITDHINKKNGV
tara:strand:+ start:562 stop:834 length:273 start_codon:yes stop_codon:yes gene_type:complete